MLMPTAYGDTEAGYRRLTEGVAMWDVACERQIQLRGPDARRLAQVLSARAGHPRVGSVYILGQLCWSSPGL